MRPQKLLVHLVLLRLVVTTSLSRAVVTGSTCHYQAVGTKLEDIYIYAWQKQCPDLTHVTSVPQNKKSKKEKKKAIFVASCATIE